MRIIFGNPAGIGDELCVTPSIRVIRQKQPDERIILEGFRRPELFYNNPYLPGGSSDNGVAVELNHNKFWNCPTLPIKFARAIGLELPPRTRPELYLSKEELSDDFGVKRWRRTIAIDTWSSGPSRRYPLHLFQRVVDILNSDGWQVIEVGRHEGKRLTGVLDFRQRLTIRQTAAAIVRCSLYLGNDSGNFHIAAAVKVPQVALFSVTPSARRAYSITVPIDGTGCGGWGPNGCNNVCPRGPEPKCLAEIQPERVVEAVRAAFTKFERR